MKRYPEYEPNCVGAALAAIGYAEDGWYHPDEILYEFREVPREEAEIAVSYEKTGLLGRIKRVHHVVALNPENPNLVTQRFGTGKPLSHDMSFDRAIGSRHIIGEKIIYMRRNSFPRPQKHNKSFLERLIFLG